MSAHVLTKILPTIKRKFKAFSFWRCLGHFLVLFFLYVLFIDYLKPVSLLGTLFLAGLFWFMSYHDYKTREIDMRVLGVFFLLGIALRPWQMLFSLYLGITTFFILHILHELFAKIVPKTEEEPECGFHFQSDDPIITEDNAPGYMPTFLLGLILVLGIYTLRIPLPESVLLTVYQPVRYPVVPPAFWVLPLILFLISIGFYYRNHKAMLHGNNVVYRGFGDGDVYFIGASSGVFGFFTTLSAIFFSLIFAYFLMRRLRHILRQREKENQTS